MSSTYLTLAASTPTSAQKGTMSCWVKRSTLGSTQYLMAWDENSTSYSRLYFNTSDNLAFKSLDGGNNYGELITSRGFRDTSAWYHIVCAIDTTNGTSGDRIKLYVNGVRETSFGTETQPSVNRNLKIGEAAVYIGMAAGAGFSGSMSHINYVDGTQYQASDFGSTDSTTGEWKINTSPSVTYGLNGFFILKNGNSVTDQSGQSNNFTVGGGTLTKTEDCPSNVFPIFNGMYCPKSSTNAAAFLNGGTTVGGSPSDASSIASMGARSGKYYWEIKVQNATNTRSCGVVRSDSTGVHSAGIYPGGNGNASIWTVAYNMVNGYVQKNDNGTQTQQGSLATLTTNDILGVALNLTDYEIKWYKNGSLVTTTSLSANWVAYGEFLLPCNRTDGSQFVQYNFGNGCFASTQLTGTTYQGTGGIGIFKYQPPTNFLALCTRNLNI